MIIKRKSKKTTVVGKENSSAFLVFDNNTHDIIDFNETWERSEIREARKILNKRR